MPLSMTDQMTALEATKRSGNADAYHIIEGMLQTNQMLADMPVYEANDGTSHLTTVRTTQPSGTRRKYNEGIVSHASTTKNIRDLMEMLEDYSVIDKNIVDHSSNKTGLINTEIIAFLNGMGETQAEDLIYGDNGQDETQMNGLAVRRRVLNAENCVSAGGSGSDLTSIYIVGLGPQFVHLFHPKGRNDVGVKREDRGLQDWPIISGGVMKTMPAYVNFFSAHFGLALRNEKALQRIANIESTISADTLIEIVLARMNKLPVGCQSVAIYANSDMVTKIDKAAWSKSNAVFPKEDPWGNLVTHVRRARVRQVDAILNTEDAIA